MAIKKPPGFNPKKGTLEVVYDRKGLIEIAFTIIAWTETEQDGWITVFNDPDCPKRGRTYQYGNEGNDFYRCKEQKFKQHTACGTGWEIDLTFDSLVDVDGMPGRRWTFEQFQKPIEVDKYGAPILNTARDPYDPPIEIDDARTILTITKRLFSFDPNWAMDHNNHLNADDFLDAPPGTVKLRVDSAQEVHDPELGTFWEVPLSFHFKKEGWQPQILSRGTHQLIGGKRYRIKDTNGEYVDQPVLLNEDGTKADEGSPGYFKKYEAYFDTNLSGLI